jgi:hypothetical protein
VIPPAPVGGKPSPAANVYLQKKKKNEEEEEGEGGWF